MSAYRKLYEQNYQNHVAITRILINRLHRGVGRGSLKGLDEPPFQTRIYFKNS